MRSQDGSTFDFRKRLCFLFPLLCVSWVALAQTSSATSPETSELLRRIEELEQQTQRLELEKQQLVQQLQDAQEEKTQLESETSSLGYFELSLEDLMDVELTGGLTKTTRRKMPSTMTIVEQEDIRHSGARNLLELLEIYVPGFQWNYSSIFPRHMGLRGINDSRDDKYLLLVNGRQMNEKTNFGAFTERDLPMLGDLQRVEVVRGPGSALYGPGALAMVINLITDTPRTFEGSEVNLRTGIVEEYYSTEFKWGKMFSEDEGLFVYGGGTMYPGADQEYSNVRFAAQRATKYGTPYYIDEYFDGRMKNYNEAYRGLPKLKFHVHYLNDNLDIWARYTQGGEYVEQAEWGVRDILYGMGYRQSTIAAEYKQEISDDFSLNYRLSYDRTQIETSPHLQVRYLQYREDKYQARVQANWTLNDHHLFAFGGELSYDEYGLDGDGQDLAANYRFDATFGDPAGTEMPRWNTSMRSLFGEYQWIVNDKWTSFVSARLDDHTYVERLFSPRWALVYTPTDRSTWKFMASRSSRTNVAQEMKIDVMKGKNNSDPETLRAYELRYEQRPTKQWSWALAGFWHDHDVVAWNYTTASTGPVGNFKSFGLEFETGYKTDKKKVLFSHAFTKLAKAKLAEGVNSTELTAAVGSNSRGTDFANWSNHQSKLVYEAQLDDRWLLTSSGIVYWGYPGGDDYAWQVDASDWARYDKDGADAFFEPSIFWNMGLECMYSENTTLRFDAYNILGWFEKDAGKRKFIYSAAIPAMYRCQPPAFGVQLTHKF